MKDDIVEGYNWTRFPFREDPNTHQRICKDCWNGRHGQMGETASGGRRMEFGCKVDGCCCLCYAESVDIARERGLKSARTVERKKMEVAALESPDNPLRAVNPAYQGRA